MSHLSPTPADPADIVTGVGSNPAPAHGAEPESGSPPDEPIEADASPRTLELVRANRELQRQIAADTTLARISTRFLAVAGDEVDDLILESLKAVCAHLKARIGAVFLADRESNAYQPRHVWRASCPSVNGANLPAMPFGPATEFVEQLLAEEGLYLPDAGLLPEAGSATPEALAAPILRRGEDAGFVLIVGGHGGRAWDEIDLRLVKMAAQIFSTALQRKAMEEENLQLQQQLIQSQKMEAVGNLTGGIAHDFNNMLVPILGYSALLEEGLRDHSKLHSQAKEIQRAAESAATLTKQLLAFSRRQVLEKEVCDLNEVIEDSRGMIQHLIGEKELRFDAGDGPVFGLVDKGQIQQVLMNLCINARDAIDGPGVISVRTGKLAANSPQASALDGAPGAEWFCVSVSDTGVGMSAETAGRIFEPFFSTKGAKGTGLGLSVVHGIVKQHGGEIRLESRLGEGSTFYIYLPLQNSRPVKVSAPSVTAINTAGNGERVLIVEDEPQVQLFVSRALQSRGYSVDVAENAAKARDLLENARHFRPFDLILCDCVLPDGNGVELLEEQLQLYPNTKAILSTGYTEREALAQAAKDYDMAFLQKPYSLDKLFETVRTSLDLALAG